MNKCKIEGCEKPGQKRLDGTYHYPKGFCYSHYRASRRSIKPLYQTWDAMKQRCYNPKCKLYSYYGGRGISMSSDWLGDNGYNQFCIDMGEKPSKAHSLDRIDNNGNYSKSNCRWANKFEQQANMRSNNPDVGINFDIQTQKWKAYIGSPPNRKYLGYFKEKEDAIIARKEAEKSYVTPI